MKHGGLIHYRLASLFVVITLMVPIAMFQIPGTGAQDDPPPFGEGDWIINSNTVVTDETLRIKGNIRINSGASLTLQNTTLLLYMTFPYDLRFEAKAGSSLFIYDNSFIAAFDARFAMYLEPGSSFRMKNSTLSNFTSLAIGSRDAIIEDSTVEFMQHGISTWGGDVDIYRTNFYDNSEGIWNVYGNVNLRDSYFLGNSVGYFTHGVSNLFGGELFVWAPSWFFLVTDANGNSYPIPRNAMIERNEFVNSFFAGVQFNFNSPGIVRNNEFRNSNTYGVTVFDSDAYVEDNLFKDSKYGIAHSLSFQYPGHYYLYLKNNDFYNCWKYGVYTHATSEDHTEWTVDKEIYSDSELKLRGTIDIEPTGHLKMNDTKLLFNPFDVDPMGIKVRSGGKVTFDDVVMGPAWNVSERVFFDAGLDTTVTIRNSTIQDVGYSWGTNGQWGGVFSKGELLVEDSVIDGGMYGIINGGGHALVKDSQIGNNSYGLFSTDGLMEVYNSTVADQGLYDLSITGGAIDLYNVTFDRSQYNVASGTLDVYWDCDLQTMWQNGNPVGNVSYEIREKDNTLVATGITDKNGLSERYWLREYTEVPLSATETTPHNISGSVLGLTNSTLQKVKTNIRLEFFIEDIVDPELNITSPGLRAYLTNSTLIVNGTAADNESGLDKVQWSFDQDLWNDALGGETWNFTVVLGYGTRAIYVRALDKAGNTKTLRMTVTIDKDAPYLVVMSPKNGFVTPLRNVLVEGFAEMGSTVSINDESILVMDGTFRLSVPLIEGPNLLQVTATDPTGNTNSTEVTVHSDTTPPEIVVDTPPEDYVTNKITEQLIKVAGHSETGALFYINGVSVQLDVNGSFNFTFSLEEGLNVINFLARDGVGNQNTTVRRVIYDLKDPVLSVYSPIDGTYTNETTVLVTGLTEPGTDVTADTGAFASNTTSNREGRFTMSVGLKEGDNLINVVAMDIAGNTKEHTVFVIRDTIAPKIQLFNAFDGMVLEVQNFMLEGETQEGAKVKINNELVTLGFTGQFSHWLYLPSANNTFKIEVVDKAGNWNSTELTLKRKMQEPTVKPGVSVKADYYPWILVVVVVVLVVQWVFLTKYFKDRKDKGDEVEDIRPIPKARRTSKVRYYARPDKDATGPRVQQRRQAPPIEEEHEGPEDDEPEFDIEFGDGRDQGGDL